MSNIKRIQRYKALKVTQNNEKSTEMERKSTPSGSFLQFLLNAIRNLSTTFSFDNRVFGFLKC